MTWRTRPVSGSISWVSKMEHIHQIRIQTPVSSHYHVPVWSLPAHLSYVQHLLITMRNCKLAHSGKSLILVLLRIWQKLILDKFIGWVSCNLISWKHLLTCLHLACRGSDEGVETYIAQWWHSKCGRAQGWLQTQGGLSTVSIARNRNLPYSDMQDLSVDETEIRSKYETGDLGKVGLLYMLVLVFMILTWI